MTGKNAEGYPDPTASIAIGLVTKREKEKEKMKDTANPEEIWMIQSAQGDVPALVLADDGQTAVFIKLRQTSITCQDIEITYRGKMYANPMMIQYTRSDNIISFEKSLPASEAEATKRVLADTFGLLHHVQGEPLHAIPVEEYTEQISMREDALTSEITANAGLTAQIQSLKVALARCEGESDVYKELFTNAH